MLSTRRFLIVLSTALVSICPLIPAAASAAEVPLGEAPTLPEGATPIGVVAPQRELRLQVALEPRDPAGLEAFATEVSTPGTPAYGHYLSVEAFAARFGATPSQVTTVSSALKAHGLAVGQASGNGLSLPVEATVAEAAAAFGTSFERVRTADGRVAFVNTSAPEVPAAAAPYVAGVLGLGDVNVPTSAVEEHAPASLSGMTPRPDALDAATPNKGPQPCAEATELENHEENGHTADEVAYSYSLSGFYAAGNLGAGQSVALFELEPYLPSDIAKYQACYGTHAAVEAVDVEGGPGTYAEGDGGESELDIEQVVGLAPEAKIVVYQGSNSNNSATMQILTAWVTENRAKVMSSSWGACEAETEPSEMGSVDTLLQEAAAQGQSFFVAAGDDGASDCFERGAEHEDKANAVDYPGSDPFATSVGGTRLEGSSVPPEEFIWSEGEAGGGGGGGVSAGFTMPTYQEAAAPLLRTIDSESSSATCHAASGYCREVPDVSANANPNTGYIVFAEKKWQLSGGTSAAAPVWAAFTALADASPACAGKAIGFANPALYAIGGTAYEANFNDVTGAYGGVHDSNNLFDESLPFIPGVHYDMATGIGTPIGTTLGASLCALAPTPPPTLSTAPPSDPATPAQPTPDPSAPTDQGADTSPPATAPTPVAHLKGSRLAGIAKGAPKLSLGLEARSGARLESVTISLPPGLATVKTKKVLAAGIVATAGKRLKATARTVGRSIQVTLPFPASAITLRIGAPALAVTPKLRERVRAGRAKQLALVVTIRESGGQSTRFTLTLPL